MCSITKRFAPILGLTIAFASTAGAAIVYFPGQNIPIPTTFEGVSVDFETGAVTNDLEGAPGMDLNFVLGGAGITNDADETAVAPSTQFVRTGTSNTDAVDNLTFGVLVGPGNTYAVPADFGGSTSHHLPFVSGQQGYVGFEMEIAGPTTVYGWALVTLQDDNTPGVIHEWAYKDDGAPILVGQTIPEPSHALLVVFGLATLALRRRR